MGLTEAIKTAAVPNEPAILAQIHEFFSRYGPTFVELADGERSDLNALLEFYGAPLRFIGSNFHMVMKDDAEITGEEGMGGEIDRLRHAHFAGSALDRCDIKILNTQAALIDALWVRRNSTGTVMARFGVIYLMALTPQGWRITSAVNISE
ncbi:MAG TPA: hypothetical protein VN911_00280 [Candidatus Acidoferrum sp.]|jgi:hypothetical protein|nr:hypothetical protein [Candidatus Acidoferrum sp.]